MERILVLVKVRFKVLVSEELMPGLAWTICDDYDYDYDDNKDNVYDYYYSSIIVIIVTVVIFAHKQTWLA